MIKPLSPAAQAVLDAANGASSYGPDDCLNDARQIAAATLRAAADQVVSEVSEPDWGACNEMRCDIELYADHKRKRAALLAIAAELEGKLNAAGASAARIRSELLAIAAELKGQ